MEKETKKKVVLAYSGGLDTSVLTKWLEQQGYTVICLAVNVGQREDFSALKKKALCSGAKKCIVSDLRSEFIESFVWPALQFHARYEGRYLLGTSLARPLIGKELVRIAKKEGAQYIAHGATGKGNDQVRFELTAYALDPEIKIIAPWRMKEFNSVFKGRADLIQYANDHNIPVKATAQKPWSSDENALHISFEAGMLEDPKQRPNEEMFELTVSPEKAPNEPQQINIAFECGIPVALNGKKMKAVELLSALNEIGGTHGVGRTDIVESRYVGMKSRGVYETPGGTILYAAHRDIECLTCDRDVMHLKDTLMPQFARLVYNGYWFSHEMECLLALLKESQRKVSGLVSIELYKGNVTVIGRSSKESLYDAAVASMEDDEGAYTQADATGFIRLHALPLKVQGIRNKQIKKFFQL